MEYEHKPVYNLLFQHDSTPVSSVDLRIPPLRKHGSGYVLRAM
jgi:hypothetical protein